MSRSIIASRIRVALARRLIDARRRIIQREERLWGLAAPSWRWRVPNVP